MKKLTRLLSVFLVVAMLLSTFPAYAHEKTSPAEASPSGPVTRYEVRNWNDLKKALTASGTATIILKNDVEEEIKRGQTNDPAPTVEIQGNKTLDLNGYDIVFTDKSNADAAGNQIARNCDRTLFVVSAGATFTLDDTSGSAAGEITYDGHVVDSDYSYLEYCQRHLFEVYGTMIVNGGILRAGRDETRWVHVVMLEWNRYTHQIWGRAVTVRSGGKFISNGGTYYGNGEGYLFPNDESGILPHVRGCVVQLDDGATAVINNGNFHAKGGADVFQLGENAGLTVWEANMTLSASAHDIRYIQRDEFNYGMYSDPGSLHVPDSAWRSRLDRVAIRLDGKWLYTHSEKYPIHLDEQKEDVWLKPSSGGKGVDKLRIALREGGNLIHNGSEVTSFTWEPSSQFARMTYPYQAYFGSTDTMPDYGITYTWRIWKGDNITGDKYLNPELMVTTTDNHIDMEELNVDWTSAPVWTVEGRVEETFRGSSGFLDASDMVKVLIDPNVFQNQKPQMPAGKTTLYKTIRLGDSDLYGFSAKALHSNWVADGYSTRCEMTIKKDGTTLYEDQNSSTIAYVDLKDYAKSAGVYVVTQTIGCYKNIPSVGEISVGGKIHEFIVTVEGALPTLNGSIAYTSTVVYDSPVTVKLTGEVANLKENILSWQWQTSKDGFGWLDIPGATEKTYTPTADDVGAYIRVHAKAEGYRGTLCSTGKVVEKGFNYNRPEKPQLTSNGKELTITNYTSEQEYVYAQSPYEMGAWNTATPISGKTFTVLEYGTYYVYTRYKETETTKTGYYVAENWVVTITQGSGDIQAWKVTYPAYGNAGITLYVAEGETIVVGYCFDPANANYDLPDLVANGSNITVKQDAEKKQLTITGVTSGTASVIARKAGKDYSWQDHPNKYVQSLNVRVYKPGELGYGDYRFHVNYGDVTITQGDTCTPASPEEAGITFTPEQAGETYNNYRWYVIASRTYSSVTYGTMEENGVLSIDPKTGTVTALKPGTATVYLFALKDSDKDSLPNMSMPTRTYQVTVEAAPEKIAVEQVTITPDALNLESGNTAQLHATVSPTNATKQQVTWTSADTAVATVDSNGKVIAVGAGETTIIATADGVSDVCNVTVYSKEHTHEGVWLQSGDQHFRICTVCGLLEVENHTYGDWVVTTEATCTADGMKTHTCTRCGVEDERIVPAMGHLNPGWSVSDTHHWQSCARGCGEVFVEEARHHYHGTNTCSVCNHTRANSIQSPMDCPRDETCPMSRFTDLSTNAWYHDGVHYCIDRNLMNGMSETAFAPQTNLSRAMVAVLLYRMAGEPAVSGNSPFVDVPAGIWYTDAVVWAYQNNIVKGISETQFAPNSSVTRQQTAVLLYRFAAFNGEDVSARTDLSLFIDAAKVDGYAVEAMSWAVAEGIINGVAENGTVYLQPQGTTTRAQYATIIYRYLEF